MTGGLGTLGRALGGMMLAIVIGGTYAIEIIRGGMQSIGKEQIEADIGFIVR